MLNKGVESTERPFPQFLNIYTGTFVGGLSVTGLSLFISAASSSSLTSPVGFSDSLAIFFPFNRIFLLSAWKKWRNK